MTLTPPELAPVRQAFLDGAHFIYGHTVMQRVLDLGYQSEWAQSHLPTRRQRNEFYTKIGYHPHIVAQQSLGLELAEYGVRVNAVCPGNLLDSPLWVDSLYAQYTKKWGITEEQVRQKCIDQVPMKRSCTYDDVTNVIVFLASYQAGYMRGQAINVTGGQEMR